MEPNWRTIRVDLMVDNGAKPHNVNFYLTKITIGGAVAEAPAS